MTPPEAWGHWTHVFI